eukprot:TRINITY_DN21386_c0_g1_i2.p2 TRINITY_DN21386_c0_g1~~TRINITY_DN21386_c0_g1_i2.p2  ORF type:complete len:245 (-),score=59.33 TRINITY_DN21386_c0_g1_i2:15-749(-)
MPALSSQNTSPFPLHPSKKVHTPGPSNLQPPPSHPPGHAQATPTQPEYPTNAPPCNRIAESDSIDLKVVTDNEKLKANLGHLITESPNVLFSNQINLPREGLQTKWTFSMPIKEYYHVGDTVEIEAQYEATTAQNDPTALKSISLEISLAMDLKFAHLDEKYEVKLEKTRYENIIPPKTKHTFKMAYHLDPKMFQIFGDKQIYIWPNVDTGLENNFRLTVRSVGSVFTQDVEIVSIPLKAILLR